MKHEERKIKAIELLKQLDIYKPYIKGFEENNQVCFFERFGGYWVDQEPEVYNKMKEIEKRFNYTVYNAVNSLIINIVYYGIFFVLYLTKTITFTMDVIILMFGFGMVAHFVISIVEEKVFLRKKEAFVADENAESGKEETPQN